MPGSCRLAFGPAGLYAAEVEAALAGAAGLDGLRAALGRVLGAPSRGAETTAPVPGVPRLEAAWLTPEWTVTLARLEREPGAAVAVVRAEYDRAAPPVVAGVPLWRRREAVEALLERHGSVLVHAEEVASQYLACPEGSVDAQSCHRGPISVYTTWAYPPLLPSPPWEPGPGTSEAAGDEGKGGAGPSR